MIHAAPKMQAKNGQKTGGETPLAPIRRQPPAGGCPYIHCTSSVLTQNQSPDAFSSVQGQSIYPQPVASTPSPPVRSHAPPARTPPDRNTTPAPHPGPSAVRNTACVP